MTDRLRNKIAIIFGAGSVGPGRGNGKATAVLTFPWAWRFAMLVTASG